MPDPYPRPVAFTEPSTRSPAVRDLRKTGLDPDFWYPLAQSRDVKPGKAIGRAFAGNPVVIFRSTAGDAYALENRCAHRQVPLDRGLVNGDRLQCSYHGWAYDRSGRCVNIPYFDRDCTLPNGVRSYPLREAYGLIFVYMGDVAKPGYDRFPQVPAANDPRYKTRYLDRRVDCHYSFMHENLMDMNHQFLHRKLMGRIRTVFLDLRRGDDWVECDYSFARTAGRQPLGEWFMINRRAESPDPTNAQHRDIMTIRTDYPYQSLKFWTAGSNEPALDLWNCYIPVDRAQRVNQTFGLMNIRRPSTPGLINLLWPAIIWFTEGIFAEDRTIVESEQKAFDDQGEDRNNEVFPAIQALRALLTSRGVPIAAAR